MIVHIKLDRACIKAPLMQSHAMWLKINGFMEEEINSETEAKAQNLQSKGNRIKGIHHKVNPKRRTQSIH